VAKGDPLVTVSVKRKIILGINRAVIIRRMVWIGLKLGLRVEQAAVFYPRGGQSWVNPYRQNIVKIIDIKIGVL
jgi:hypothetical protein